MISIVLPTFNEVENIEAMICRVRKAISETDEIIVVDDNSPDGTSLLVQKMQLKDPYLRLVVRIDESGLTSATQRGIEEAKGDIIIWLDADLSQPPEKIPLLIEKIKSGRYDIVVASRYVKGGGDVRSEAKNSLVTFQVFLSATLRSLTSFILRCPFKDWSSGYIAIKRGVALSLLPLQGDYGEYFLNLIYRAFKRKYKITEIPYTLTARQHGESKTATTFLGMAFRGIGYLRAILKCLILERRVKNSKLNSVESSVR